MNPTRAILLAMAGSPTWQRLITGLPVTRRVVARFIPGESLEEAIAAVRTIGAQGMSATLNPLGEHVASMAQAASAAATYVRIVDRIADNGLNCGLSVKLTMLGLDLGPELAAENLRVILQRAAPHGVFVRIDMESSSCVDATLAIHRQLVGEFPLLGVVIQSYLRRSAADVDRLADAGASIRVVKGAYREPPEIAFRNKADVDASFLSILERLARPDAVAHGVRVAVASHDPKILRAGRILIQERGLRGWEFQMLYGIGVQSQQQLAAAGYPVRIYLSYGPSWYPWFMRRLAERPANLLFFIRHLVS